MASQNIRIHGPISRDINKELWERDIVNMKQLEDEDLARLAVVSTIFEGNKTPLGITAKQDVAKRRVSPALLQKIVDKTVEKGRLSLDGTDIHAAKMALLQDKARGELTPPRVVMTRFNGEDQQRMIEKTGNDYVGWLSQTLIDIATNPKNDAVRKMMGSLLDVNSRDRR